MWDEGTAFQDVFAADGDDLVKKGSADTGGRKGVYGSEGRR